MYAQMLTLSVFLLTIGTIASYSAGTKSLLIAAEAASNPTRALRACSAISTAVRRALHLDTL